MNTSAEIVTRTLEKKERMDTFRSNRHKYVYIPTGVILIDMHVVYVHISNSNKLATTISLLLVERTRDIATSHVFEEQCFEA